MVARCKMETNRKREGGSGKKLQVDFKLEVIWSIAVRLYYTVTTLKVHTKLIHFFLFQSGLQLKVRLEEIRLLESRKSSRLMSQSSTDFSKLADFNIVHERKRLNSEKSSDGSEFLG